MRSWTTSCSTYLIAIERVTSSLHFIWHLLVQVSRRWRQIIFESPQRLNLQIRCPRRTPVRKNLGIWPPLPIAVDLFSMRPLEPIDKEDAITVFEYPGRISSVRLYVTESLLEKMIMAMQEPFPWLTRLEISQRLENRQSFLPNSWEGLYRLYRKSSSTAFPTRPYQHFFCLPGISFPSISGGFLRLGIFHLK